MKLRVVFVIVFSALILTVAVLGHVYLKNTNSEFLYLLDMSVKNVDNDTSEKYFDEFCKRWDDKASVIGLMVHGEAVKEVYSAASELKILYRENAENKEVLNGLNALIFEINKLYEEHTVNFKSLF